MSSFESLPLEVREEIYSYLLLDTDAVPPEDTDRPQHMISNYQASLFRVNRRISAETIDYFYKRNAFTEFLLSHSDSGQIGWLRNICPIKVRRERPITPALSVNLQYTVGRYKDPFVDRDRHCIVAAQWLSLFIRIFKQVTLKTREDHDLSLSSLEVNSTDYWFRIWPSTRECVISSLRLLRPALHEDEDSSQSTIRDRLWTKSGIKVSPPANSHLNWYSESRDQAKDALADLQGIAQHVDHLFEQGRFYQVILVCKAAEREQLFHHSLRLRLTQQEDGERCSAYINILMIACLVYAKLGRKGEALRSAYNIRYWINPPDHLRIRDQLAAALTDGGRLGTVEEYFPRTRADFLAVEREWKASYGVTLLRLRDLAGTFWPEMNGLLAPQEGVRD